MLQTDAPYTGKLGKDFQPIIDRLHPHAAPADRGRSVQRADGQGQCAPILQPQLDPPLPGPPAIAPALGIRGQAGEKASALA